MAEFESIGNSITCHYCGVNFGDPNKCLKNPSGEITHSYDSLSKGNPRQHGMFKRTLDKLEAQRNPISVRYDILDPDFLKSLAQIAHYGAEIYGDFNWHKSRLEGDKSPVNHIYKHLGAYRNAEPYDHKELGQARKWHLAAVAFNAMMEFWYENQEDDKTEYKSNDATR